METMLKLQQSEVRELDILANQVKGGNDHQERGGGGGGKPSGVESLRAGPSGVGRLRAGTLENQDHQQEWEE